MLRSRILTALLLIPLVTLALLYFNTQTVALSLSSFALLAAWEWSYLSGLSVVKERLMFTCTTLLLLILAFWFIERSSVTDLSMLVVLMMGAWWVTACLWMFDYQRGGGGMPKNKWLSLFVGILLLVSTWVAIVFLHRQGSSGPYLVIVLMSLVWSADSAAYFVGKQWGKYRLADKISPGKTWEGFIGSLVATAAVALILSLHFEMDWHGRLVFTILCIITVIFSVLGDLFESMLKRQAGVKDSGHILPGHGGVLDRIDSLTGAAPIFCFLIIHYGVV